MNKVIHAAFAVIEIFRLDLQAGTLRKPSGQHAFDLDKEFEDLVRIGAHSQQIRRQTESCVKSQRHVVFSIYKVDSFNCSLNR
jgi:hypothetical protein